MTSVIAIVAVLASAFVSMLGMSVQFGGGRMGGVPIPASGMTTQNFLNMPPGPVDTLNLHIGVTGKSSAGGFTLAVATGDNAAAEGADDMDDLLDALFSKLELFWEPENMCFSLTPSQLRTILGTFNKRDFGGNFINGGAVPAVGAPAATWDIVVRIPVSLARYFFDGAIFTNGASRLKHGALNYYVASSTPSVVLTSGTLVVSALTVDLDVDNGAGHDGDIGPTWRVTRIAGLPTVHSFPAASGGRLALFDVNPPSTSAVTAITVDNFTLKTPNSFAARYQGDKLSSGGYDVTKRITPYLFLEQDMRFNDLENVVGKPIRMDAMGVSSMTVYDIQAIVPDGMVSQRVATAIGGGGSVDIGTPTPPSLPVGSAISPVLAGIVPKRILPSGLSRGGSTAASPVAASNLADKRKAVAASAATRVNKLLGR